MTCSKCKKVYCYGNCCGNVSPATPMQPYCPPQYACQEDHCQQIINQQFAAALKVTNSWNVPACGESATLYIQGIILAAVGSYLWSSNYGYFEIVSYDADTNQVVVENPCFDGNAAEGTTVPACTLFVVTDGPIAAAGSGAPSIYPYVAVDFTAPADSTCLLITVTNVNGLVVGKNVQIGAGTYRVNSIPDGTHIEVCNDGEGITPGTAVFAKNAAGQFQYQITLIDANPCTNPAVNDGCLVVCKDDNLQPLSQDGILAGMVPMVIADGECDVQFVFLDVPTRTCATLGCCLTLVPGTTTYVITVSDSSEFQVGDVLQIGTRTDRWTVDDIIDGTHIEATTDTNPAAVEEIAEGTSICIVDCCEQIENTINELLPDPVTVNQAVQVNDGSVTLDTGNTTLVGTIGQITVVNPSSVRDLQLTLTLNSFLSDAQGEDANTDMLIFDHRIYLATANPPPTAIIGGDQSYFFKDDTQHPVFSQRVWTFNTTITAGQTVTYYFKTELEWKEAGASKLVLPAADNLRTRVVAFGTAL